MSEIVSLSIRSTKTRYKSDDKTVLYYTVEFGRLPEVKVEHWLKMIPMWARVLVVAMVRYTKNRHELSEPQ